MFIQSRGGPQELALLVLSRLCVLAFAKSVFACRRFSSFSTSAPNGILSSKQSAAAYASRILPSRYPPFSPGSKDAVMQVSDAMES